MRCVRACRKVAPLHKLEAFQQLHDSLAQPELVAQLARVFAKQAADGRVDVARVMELITGWGAGRLGDGYGGWGVGGHGAHNRCEERTSSGML
jgi:hypothetical protein